MRPGFYIPGVVAFLALLAAPLGNATPCASAAGCEFWDGDYHQRVGYPLGSPTIDVLVVPSASPFVVQDTATIEMAVDVWDAAIAGSGFAYALPDLERHTLGSGVPPVDALTDPEIVILAGEDPFAGLRTGVSTNLCAWRDGVEDLLPVEDLLDPGSGKCLQGRPGCVIAAAHLLFEDATVVYDFIAREVGRCLGLGGVGDGQDFDAKTIPSLDLLGDYVPARPWFPSPPPGGCVSNLNLEALRGLYANLLGQSGQLAPGSYVHMAPASYAQVPCANP